MKNLVDAYETFAHFFSIPLFISTVILFIFILEQFSVFKLTFFVSKEFRMRNDMKFIIFPEKSFNLDPFFSTMAALSLDSWKPNRNLFHFGTVSQVASIKMDCISPRDLLKYPIRFDRFAFSKALFWNRRQFLYDGNKPGARAQISKD